MQRTMLTVPVDTVENPRVPSSRGDARGKPARAGGSGGAAGTTGETSARALETKSLVDPGALQPSIDAGLVQRVAGGDAQAFSALVDLHLGIVRAIAQRTLQDPAEAEDIAQEAFLRLWRNAATLEIGPYGVRPWLRRVAANLCIDRIRAARHVTVVADVPEQAVAPSQGVALESGALATRVDAALLALPDRQRMAIVLFHYEGLSQIEVGSCLGVSDEAVESLLGRARRALKAALKDEWLELLPET